MKKLKEETNKWVSENAAWGTKDFPMSDEKAKKFYEKKQEEIKELEALLQEPYTE